MIMRLILLILFTLIFPQCENPNDPFYNVTPGAKKKYEKSIKNCQTTALLFYLYALSDTTSKCNDPNSENRKKTKSLEECIQKSKDDAQFSSAVVYSLCGEDTGY